MELSYIFPTKVAHALGRRGINSVEQLQKIFDEDPACVRRIREIGDAGFAIIEYMLKVELP